MCGGAVGGGMGGQRIRCGVVVYGEVFHLLVEHKCGEIHEAFGH